MSAKIQRSQSVSVDSKGVISTIKKLSLTTRLKKQKSTNSETNGSNGSLNQYKQDEVLNRKYLLNKQHSIPNQQQDDYDRQQNGKKQNSNNFIRTLSSKFTNKKTKQYVYETPSDVKINHHSIINTNDLMLNGNNNMDKVSLKSDMSANIESNYLIFKA